MNSNLNTAFFWVPGPLPGLNEIIAAAKSGRGSANAYHRVKKQWTNTVAVQCLSAGLRRQPFKGPVRICLDWIEPNRRRDRDNVSCGAKFVIDGLVAAGVISSDGWNTLYSIVTTWAVDKNRPGVAVTILAVP